ncbi:MAG TPA: alpha-glucuronidase family glycosyl hydrolase [Verrucomicrobiae bacterium]|nr:alpha-glucuronidase family glycosyl hydrolase [Verrucomicrobiae bacterium]
MNSDLDFFCLYFSGSRARNCFYRNVHFFAFMLGWLWVARPAHAQPAPVQGQISAEPATRGPAAWPLVSNGKSHGSILAGDNPGELTRRAVSELQRYIAKISGAQLPLLSQATVGAQPAGETLVVLGTAAQNEILSEMLQSGVVSTSGLKPEGYALKSVTWKGHPAMVIVGADEPGVLYGSYELLEQLGITFRLTGDIVPQRRDKLVLPSLDMKKSPAFPRRGFLFASNFDNASAFSWPDYEQFLDQMARMKCNYLQFWWFAFEPWLQYAYKGETNRSGDVSSKESGYQNWTYGGFGSRTIDDVSIGREHFEGRQRLAPLELQHVETPGEAYSICRDLLRRIIAYAAQRNIKVWPVIELASLPPNLARHAEMVGDTPFNYIFGSFVHPLDPVTREIQLSRLKALAETYPQAEGFFLNFAELYPDLLKPKYANFFRQQRPRFEELRALALPWSSTLANIYSVDIDQVVDSNIGYFDLFTYLLKQRDQVLPGLRMGLMTTGRGYALPLFNKWLPSDIPFASLESSGVWTRDGVPMRYFGNMGQRERILQPRVDDDFDMLGMQFSVGQYARKDRIFVDGVKYGLSGVAGQIERARGTEFNSSFLARASWEPGLTPEEFYRDSSERIFGQDAAPEMYQAFLKLEANQAYLDYYEYDGGYGVLPCCGGVREVSAAYAYWQQRNIYDGPVMHSWKARIDNSTDAITHHERSIALLNQALDHLQAATTNVAPRGRYELNYLINRTEVLRDVFAALNDFRRGMVQFDDAFVHRKEMEHDAFVAELTASLDTLRRSHDQLEGATRHYSQIVDHVSDLAVLYHLNARVLLGTEMAISLLENVADYHRGQPYLHKVPFDHLYPPRPDMGAQE